MIAQSQCYRECGQECLQLDSLAERETCYAQCPCECNQHCYTQCQSIGLSMVCDQACGCQRVLSEEISEKSEQTSETVEVATETQELVKVSEPINTQSTGILDILVAADMQDITLTPETGFELIEPTSESVINSEFQTLLETDLDEEDDDEVCDPG